MRSAERVARSIGVLAALAALTACRGERRTEPPGPGPAPGPGPDAGRDGAPPLFETDAGEFIGDPLTCEHAAAARTYVGCEFFPTVLPNEVPNSFDYAVIVANAGTARADLVLEHAGATIDTGSVEPGQLHIFYPPWIPEAKVFNGPCAIGISGFLDTSRRVSNASYRLTSTAPVTVFQFNPLQYTGEGGPPGRDWSQCNACPFLGCFSYTNDASLLLPKTALTGNYRVAGVRGWNPTDMGTARPSYVVVTGTEDGTDVAMRVARQGVIVAGADIGAAGPGDLVRFTLNRAEAVILVGISTSDLSGSQIQASRPVQVFSGIGCANVPDDAGSCDHMEEMVFPAETLGTRYFVATPTGPRGDSVGHVVRLIGNVDGTMLSYPNGNPGGGPSQINAGDVVDLGVVEESFEIAGTAAFAVTTLLQGRTIVDPGPMGNGDPAQTNVASVEQYRDRYVFLAPTDYVVSYADVVMPMDAMLSLDGAIVGERPTPIGGGYGVLRIMLDEANGGAHRLEASAPVSLQVMGYGFATSYHYPGGLNLRGIAPPPPDLI